jgi:hypothetical protein
MKIPPTGAAICCTLFCKDRIKKKALEATPRFDAFVGRYYLVVYRFASRLSDDPGEAALLTNAALNSIRKQPWCPRDEITVVRMLLKAVVRARFTTA